MNFRWIFESTFIFNKCFIIIILFTVRVQEVSIECSRTSYFCWNQANGNICCDNLQFHCIIEYDSRPNGRRERVWRKRISPNRFGSKLSEQCYIFLHQFSDWCHHIWCQFHRCNVLSIDSTYIRHLDVSIIVFIFNVGDCLHIFAQRCF